MPFKLPSLTRSLRRDQLFVVDTPKLAAFAQFDGMCPNPIEYLMSTGSLYEPWIKLATCLSIDKICIWTLN